MWYKEENMSQLVRFISENPRDWKVKLEDTPYNLRIRYSPEYDAYIFNYNQITSDMSQRICQEARGIVLDAQDFSTRVRAFDKFFNLGEPNADPKVDFDNAYVTEKIDGSLIKISDPRPNRELLDEDVNEGLPTICFDDPSTFLISTNGTISAFDAPLEDLSGNTQHKSFGAFVENVLKDLSRVYRLGEYSSYWTYIFELVSPSNRIVVPHVATRLYYLGRRHRITGEEVPFFYDVPFDHAMFPLPEVFEFSNKEKLLEVAEQLSWKQEGFVVSSLDPSPLKPVHRVKIKGAAYLQIHRIRGDAIPTKKRIVEMILSESADDFVGYFPEYKDMVQKVRTQLSLLVKALSDEVRVAEVNKELPRKDFALTIGTKGVIPNLLFRVYEGKVDLTDVQTAVMDHLRNNISIDKLVDLLNTREENE